MTSFARDRRDAIEESIERSKSQVRDNLGTAVKLRIRIARKVEDITQVIASGELKEN